MAAPSVPPLAEKAIFLVRKQPVIRDSDLAALYGVEIRTLNQALKRNADRFPEDSLLLEPSNLFIRRLRAESIRHRDRERHVQPHRWGVGYFNNAGENSGPFS